VLFRNGDQRDQTRLENNAQFLKKLAKLADLTWLSAGEEGPVAATALVGELEILVPMAGLIDKDAELQRLGREIEKLEKDLSRIKGKLGNASFVDKAPAAVVAKEKEKMEAQQQALETLQEQQRQIAQL
jgi:valyl-tRNA synthetase